MLQSFSPKWNSSWQSLFVATTSLVVVCLVMLVVAIVLQPACQMVAKMLLFYCLVTALESNYYFCAIMAPDWSYTGLSSRVGFVWVQVRIRGVLSIIPAAFAAYLVFEDYIGLQDNPRYKLVLEPAKSYPDGLEWSSMLESNRCFSSSSGHFYFGQVVQTVVALSVVIYFGLVFVFVNLLWFLQYYTREDPHLKLATKLVSLMAESGKYLDKKQASKKGFIPRLDWYSGLVNMKAKEILFQDLRAPHTGSADPETQQMLPRPPMRDEFTTAQERRDFKARCAASARQTVRQVFAGADRQVLSLIAGPPEFQFVFRYFVAGCVKLLLKSGLKKKVEEEAKKPANPVPDTRNKDQKALPKLPEKGEESAGQIFEANLCSWCQEFCDDYQLECSHYFHKSCIQQMVLNGNSRCCAPNHKKSPEPFMQQLANLETVYPGK